MVSCPLKNTPLNSFESFLSFSQSQTKNLFYYQTLSETILTALVDFRYFNLCEQKQIELVIALGNERRSKQD